jgi:hypothetical protein
LSESERLLRQTPEILDARVLVNEMTSTRDSVDIEIYTTDVFSITAGFQLGSATAGVITLGDQNFLGQGHQLENTYEYGRGLAVYGNQQPQQWSYVGSYTAPFRNFVYAQARYRNEYNYRSGGVSVQRDFYSPSARYAGALSLNSYSQNVALVAPPAGQPYTFYPLRYMVEDAWLGRSLKLRSYDLGYENPGRIIVAARVLNTNYSAVPQPAADAVPGYQNVCWAPWAIRCAATTRTGTCSASAAPRTCPPARCSASRPATTSTASCRGATSTCAWRRPLSAPAAATSMAPWTWARFSASTRAAAGNRACFPPN